MLRLQEITRPLTRIQNYAALFTTRASSTGNNDQGQDENHPLRRSMNILKNDMKKITNFFKSNPSSKFTAKEHDNLSEKLKRFQGDRSSGATDDIFPTHCDVVVIGGGGVGSSVAYWLKEKARAGLNVVVVERDPTYERASTVLSVGGLRQQFSLPENIQMSLFGADFIRECKEHLGDCEVNFTPHGYLVLASEEGAETLKRNSKLQNELGARNEILDAVQLKRKFPWLNTDGIVLGCHGLEREGWFDPWALLMGFKKRAQEYGAQYVKGEVVGFEFKQSDVLIRGQDTEDYEGLDKLVVKMPNNELRTIKFAICVLAAGAYSGEIARLARIGTGRGMLSVPLPVEPRKRYVYVIASQGSDCPGLATPLTVDPNGTYFRRDGLCGNYLCGRSPTLEQEPSVDNLDVDHAFFENEVWPSLANRCKAFESAKVVNSWAGFYEYNIFDENGIIGTHPYYNNMIIATGFSGHGIQQTPAVGRAISELIIDGKFRTIDLSRLGFDRVIVDRPMFESNIV